jgi:hypothetical protein
MVIAICIMYGLQLPEEQKLTVEQNTQYLSL